MKAYRNPKEAPYTKCMKVENKKVQLIGSVKGNHRCVYGMT